VFVFYLSPLYIYNYPNYLSPKPIPLRILHHHLSVLSTIHKTFSLLQQLSFSGKGYLIRSNGWYWYISETPPEIWFLQRSGSQFSSSAEWKKPFHFVRVYSLV
jgi:hypothetical protein